MTLLITSLCHCYTHYSVTPATLTYFQYCCYLSCLCVLVQSCLSCTLNVSHSPFSLLLLQGPVEILCPGVGSFVPASFSASSIFTATFLECAALTYVHSPALQDRSDMLSIFMSHTDGMVLAKDFSACWWDVLWNNPLVHCKDLSLQLV